LVRESVAARIRHRALIEELSTGSFDFERYKKTFVALAKRDGDALSAQTMLTEANYLSIFKMWHSQDFERYGVSTAPKKRLAAKARRRRSKQ
jgi:hypothetical protein